MSWVDEDMMVADGFFKCGDEVEEGYAVARWMMARCGGRR